MFTNTILDLAVYFNCMATIFSEKNADLYLKELSETDANTARSYLFEYGYSSSSFEMPEYYGAKNLEQISLTPIDWPNKGKPLITSPLNFLTPKGHLSWRNFSLLHPYIFIHIVNEMTNESAWTTIKKILSEKTLVNCYSIPKFSKEENDSAKLSGINRWLQMAENDLVKDSVNFSFLTVTDIKNFYPSIYTHSISWAIHGKAEAKAGRNDMALLGNKLDKLFQNSRDGQTNGIPVGSMVSDIVAEIILKDIDRKITDWIISENLKGKLIISRYRDDYRILSKTNEHGKIILRALSKILDEYNLVLNSDKTKVFDDTIEGSFRDWSREINEDFLLRSVKYGKLDTAVSASLLKDILLKVYRLQKRFPDGRPSITLLSKLTDHLNDETVSIDVDKIDIHTTISILRKLALIREEVSTQAYLLLDILLRKLDNVPIRYLIVEELLSAVKEEKDHDYQIIWLYRLCLSNAVSMCEEISKYSNSPLVNLLEDDFRSKTPFWYDYEAFPIIQKLTPNDAKELIKFKYVDDTKLTEAYQTAIDREFYSLFKY